MRRKITIIEDDKFIANMYKFKLENEGFDVDLAHTGPAGLSLIKRVRPHLVLLDLKLPHMNGDEILEHMRKHDWGKDISVVIAANVSRDHAPWRLHLLDFDRYIVKAHYTPGEIFELISDILHKKTTQSTTISNDNLRLDPIS